MSSFERIQLSPYCVHLKSKKLVFQPRPPVSDEDILDGSGHTWCQQTQEVVGEDGEPSDPRECQKGRSCFCSYSD